MFVGIGPFFVRVSETTHPVKTHLLHPFFQLLKILLCLAGVPDQQGGADTNARHFLADLPNQGILFRSRDMPAHERQHMIRAMLQSDIEVLAYIGMLGHDIQQSLRKIRRVGVVQPDPFNPLYLCHLVHQLRQQVFLFLPSL